jgi:hypothetical protein
MKRLMRPTLAKYKYDVKARARIARRLDALQFDRVLSSPGPRRCP